MSDLTWSDLLQFLETGYFYDEQMFYFYFDLARWEPFWRDDSFLMASSQLVA